MNHGLVDIAAKAGVPHLVGFLQIYGASRVDSGKAAVTQEVMLEMANHPVSKHQFPL